MKTEDEALWNGAVSILLLDHYPEVTVEVVGFDATPPTLFVRNKSNNNNNNSSNNNNNNESTTAVRVEMTLTNVVDSVLDHLWRHRPTLERHSCDELIGLGSIWIRPKTPTATTTTTTTEERMDNPSKRRKKRNKNKNKNKRRKSEIFQRYLAPEENLAGQNHASGGDDGDGDGDDGEESRTDWSTFNTSYDITIRIHANPSRFPVDKWLQTASKMEDLIVFDEAESIGMVIVNKCGGLPSHPTVDNVSENVLSVAQNSLKKQHISDRDDRYLSTVPYRLDVDTSGLQIVCSAMFASYFGKLLEAKSKKGQPADHTSRNHHHHHHHENVTNDYRSIIHFRKLYRCLVCICDHLRGTKMNSGTMNALPGAINYQAQYEELRTLCENETVVTHYMNKDDRSTPKTCVDTVPSADEENPSSTTPNTWLDCRLKIARVGPLIRVSKDSTSTESSCKNTNNEQSELVSRLWEEDQYKPQHCTHVVEVEIELLTGRTHQIRAQLRAMGHPIVGDPLYGGTLQSLDSRQRRRFNSLALQCCGIDFPRPTMISSRRRQTNNEQKRNDNPNSLSKRKDTNRTVFVPSDETVMKYRLHDAWWTKVCS
mmetsp:Transcript_29233/g.70463  ORF Transcript_29233/g.70463 Transcript_29233/m.70463 type:complete len:597 (-) Transcript_29233:680-2470(-)